MKGLQKLFIALGIFTVLLFASSGEQKAVQLFSNESKGSYFSDDYIHSSACLQPQSTSILGSNLRFGDYTMAKFTALFLIVTTDFRLLHPASHFTGQDPGRFQKIAVLLYPFHFFW